MLGKKKPCRAIKPAVAAQVLGVGAPEALELGVLLAVGAHHANARRALPARWR